MKLLAKIALFLLTALISGFLIIWGWYGPALADGTQEMQPIQLVAGLILLPMLTLLSILGRSNPKAEKIFWYLGVGSPLILLLLAFGP
jgi:hypothetical protein